MYRSVIMKYAKYLILNVFQLAMECNGNEFMVGFPVFYE